MTRLSLLLAATLALTACGFHMRGEVTLPSGLQRVHVQIADPFSPLKRDLEAALKRGGATIEENPGADVADVVISAVSIGPVARSVGANAFVNEFSMVYHVEIEISGPDGKLLLPRTPIEHARQFTFDLPRQMMKLR